MTLFIFGEKEHKFDHINKVQYICSIMHILLSVFNRRVTFLWVYTKQITFILI